MGIVQGQTPMCCEYWSPSRAENTILPPASARELIATRRQKTKAEGEQTFSSSTSCRELDEDPTPTSVLPVGAGDAFCSSWALCKGRCSSLSSQGTQPGPQVCQAPVLSGSTPGPQHRHLHTPSVWRRARQTGCYCPPWTRHCLRNERQHFLPR